MRVTLSDEPCPYEPLNSTVVEPGQEQYIHLSVEQWADLKGISIEEADKEMQERAKHLIEDEEYDVEWKCIILKVRE